MGCSALLTVVIAAAFLAISASQLGERNVTLCSIQSWQTPRHWWTLVKAPTERSQVTVTAPRQSAAVTVNKLETIYYLCSLFHLQTPRMMRSWSARARMRKTHARIGPAADTSASTRGCGASRSEVAFLSASTGSNVTAHFLASSPSAAGMITATPSPRHLQTSVSTQNGDILSDSWKRSAKSKRLHGGNDCDGWVGGNVLFWGVLISFSMVGSGREVLPNKDAEVCSFTFKVW